MEEAWFRMFFMGGLGSTSEWVGVITFLAIGVVYLIAPALGYRVDRRSMLLVALYLLVFQMGVGLMEFLVQFGETMGSAPQMSRPGPEPLWALMVGMRILRMLFLVGGMLFFTIGLQSLRFQGGGSRPRSARTGLDEPVEAMASDEEMASRELARSQQLITQDRREEAIDLLEQLLRHYPTSRAAITARVTLRRLRTDEEP